jgi:hypothetical protein
MKEKALTEGARWVQYELQMLLYALRANEHAYSRVLGISDGPERDRWRVFDTCTQEAFLTHYRNLKNFLNNKMVYKDDDVVAGDYSDVFTGKDHVKGDMEEDTRLNRLLAHISYSREALLRENWNYPEMEERICTVFEEYLKVVKEEAKELFSKCADQLRHRRSQL